MIKLVDEDGEVRFIIRDDGSQPEKIVNKSKEEKEDDTVRGSGEADVGSEEGNGEPRCDEVPKV